MVVPLRPVTVGSAEAVLLKRRSRRPGEGDTRVVTKYGQQGWKRYVTGLVWFHCVLFFGAAKPAVPPAFSIPSVRYAGVGT